MRRRFREDAQTTREDTVTVTTGVGPARGAHKFQGIWVIGVLLLGMGA